MQKDNEFYQLLEQSLGVRAVFIGDQVKLLQAYDADVVSRQLGYERTEDFIDFVFTLQDRMGLHHVGPLMGTPGLKEPKRFLDMKQTLLACFESQAPNAGRVRLALAEFIAWLGTNVREGATF